MVDAVMGRIDLLSGACIRLASDFAAGLGNHGPERSVRGAVFLRHCQSICCRRRHLYYLSTGARHSTDAAARVVSPVLARTAKCWRCAWRGRWALLAGLCISLYTVIDRVGVTLLDPLLYTYIALWIAWVFLTPFAFREVGWNILKSELRANWISSLIAGFTNTAAYVIVLYVMQSGTRASYAGATREISVVLGVIVGVMFFKEKGTVMKLAGAACVAAGVVMITLLG